MDDLIEKVFAKNSKMGILFTVIYPIFLGFITCGPPLELNYYEMGPHKEDSQTFTVGKAGRAMINPTAAVVIKGLI